jgi:hypothetical protein
VDPSFRKNILDIAGTAGPIVTGEIDKTLAAMAFDAWRRWPTATGFSKSMLSLEYTVANKDVLVAQLRSNAWYTVYIKSFQNGLGNKQPHRVLIWNPANGKVGDAATRIGDQIARFINGSSR